MVRSSWLTAARTRRLLDVLAALPARFPGIAIDEARLRIWRFCGGPIDEVLTLIDVLVGTELVSVELGQYRLTRSGQRVIARRGAEGLRPLGLALLRCGYFHDQARELLDLGTNDPDGSLKCPTRQARRACPQLVGILEYWPEVTTAPALRIPPELLQELQAAWALLPPPEPSEAAAEAIRKTIGNRGELYSYQLERLKAEVASNIVWVARDDDNLGYDIEDRSGNPRRRIEVKASGETTVRFFLSENERRKAHTDPSSYEIQFWGGVDLETDPAGEFERLRAQGYPLVFTDLPSLLDGGQLVATPTKWRVTRATEPA